MSEVKVPEGYKQTEVGVIPEDWGVTTIGDFAPLQRGFDLPTTKVEAGDYPVVYSNGIVRNHKDFQVKGEGIVTGRSGTIGKAHYIESDFWPHNTTLWVTSFGDAHVKFVYYLFKYIGFERFKSGSGVPTLNRNDAHSFKITVPTKVDEQTAIATALSDVDNLIQSIEKLIAKKEAIKAGTMQQLLTGKTRLPEFATHDDGSPKGFKQSELGRIPEDWEVVRIIDNHIIATGNTPPTNDQRNYKGKFLFVSPADLGTNKLIHNTQKKLSLKGFKLARKFPKGSTLFTCIGSTIGKTGLATCELTSNQQINAVFPNEIDDFEFTYYALTHHSKRIKNKASEQAVPLINKTEFGQFEYMQPNELKEQNRHRYYPLRYGR